MPKGLRAVAAAIALAALIVLIAAALFARSRGRDATLAEVPSRAPASIASESPPAPAEPAPPATGVAATPSPAPLASEEDSDDADSDDSLAAADFESALRWSRVDMDAVRAALPDNLYWEMGVPSSDPEVARRREEQRDELNREWGGILSGNATTEEIQAYYGYRYQLSSDYVEFTGYMLEHYGDVLPERDVGLLQLASRMHHARLQEMPRRITEALARKAEQDAAREAWLRDEAAFDPAASDGD